MIINFECKENTRTIREKACETFRTLRRTDGKKSNECNEQAKGGKWCRICVEVNKERMRLSTSNKPEVRVLHANLNEAAKKVNDEGWSWFWLTNSNPSRCFEFVRILIAGRVKLKLVSDRKLANRSFGLGNKSLIEEHRIRPLVLIN